MSGELQGGDVLIAIGDALCVGMAPAQVREGTFVRNCTATGDGLILIFAVFFQLDLILGAR
jgi:hypothetical protein